MKMLLEHLQKNHGLAADADEAAAKTLGRQLVREKKLTVEQYGALCSGKSLAPPSAADQVPTDAEIDAAAEKAANLLTQHMEPDSAVQPADIFKTPGSQPRVKRASEQYEGTKLRKSYPTHSLTGRPLPSHLAGQDVTFEGSPVYKQSQLEEAYAGAYWKHRVASMLGQAHLLSDHDRDLYTECVKNALWVGEVQTSEGTQYFHRPTKLTSLCQKTVLADSTSGGTNAVPYFFDVDLVTFPLLFGELFPLVTQKELATSNQVKGASLGNMTISTTAEGDSPSISLQTTTSLIGSMTTDIFNATGAITFGRDFLADSPIDVQANVMQLYQAALLEWLDSVIATGDGTTEPLGLANVSATYTYAPKNNTAGPYVVPDFTGIIKTLPAQYRKNQQNVVWVGNDSTYFRARSPSVNGTTDQRLIFGYDVESYKFFNHPFKIQNDIAAADLFFVALAKYWMYRRKGMELQLSTEGKTLMLDNEILLVARSRWGGRMSDVNAMVSVTSGSVHS